jgi:Transglycosylase SLT domain
MAVDASTSVGAGPVTGAIRKAAQATGTSFDYLLATAKVESDLDPNLTMRSSSATGLFQFIEQTWLATLKQAGPAFGYGDYADAISRTASGRYVVDDWKLRDEIMQLRKDPAANALMGGAFTQQNVAVLSSRLGRPPSEGELYIGHFFGPYSGAKAIALAESNPTANASAMFPAAARANRSVFYDRQGRARSISEVCAELARRYQVARTETRTRTTASIQTAAASAKPAAPVTAASDGRRVATVPLPAMAFAASADAAAAPPTLPALPAGAESAGGIFHSLFQAGDRREAVAPAVSELWGPRTADATRRGAVPTTLDLFSDRRPNLHGGLAGD